MHFYDKVGALSIGIKYGETVQKYKLAADHGKVDIRILNPEEAMQKFPFLHVADNDEALWEENTGIINPRKMVRFI